MARSASVPPALTRGPFTLAEARSAGLTPRQLQGRAWRRIGTGLYVWTERPLQPKDRLVAAFRRLPSEAAFSGCTAAWLHGLDLPPCDPIEVVIPRAAGVAARSGILVHRANLEASDVVVRHGLRATSIRRTLADLARRVDPVEVVVLIDAALCKRLLAIDDLTEPRRLRKLALLADGRSESPMESRLRVLLIRSGLPRPESQVELYDGGGLRLARVDLFYPAARLIIEYDGGTHRDSLVADNRRQNRLLAAGYRLLRFTAADVLGNPAWVVAQVRSALRTR